MHTLYEFTNFPDPAVRSDFDRLASYIRATGLQLISSDAYPDCDRVKFTCDSYSVSCNFTAAAIEALADKLAKDCRRRYTTFSKPAAPNLRQYTDKQLAAAQKRFRHVYIPDQYDWENANMLAAAHSQEEDIAA